MSSSIELFLATVGIAGLVAYVWLQLVRLVWGQTAPPFDERGPAERR